MKSTLAAALALCSLVCATTPSVSAQTAPSPKPHHPRPSHSHPPMSSLPYRLGAVPAGAAIKTVADVRALYAGVDQRTGAQIASVDLTTWGAHSKANRKDIADHEIDPTRPVYVVHFTYPNGYHFAGETRGPGTTSFSVVDALTGAPLSFEIRGPVTHRAGGPAPKHT